MSKKSTTSKSSRKSSPDIDQLQSELERIDRKRKEVEGKIIAKASEAQWSAKPGERKPAKRTARKSAKGQKRSWKRGRPPKPYDGFPLTPHASGAWQKKIRGKIHYFGKWARVVNGKLTRIPGDGWKDALELYKAQADDLHAGRTPRNKSGEEPTVADLCNRFYTAKVQAHKADEITARTLAEYTSTTDRLVSTFGKTRFIDDLATEDFASLRADLAEQYGPVRLGNEIQRVRTVFKHGYDSGLIDKPVRFGPDFKKPPRHVMRKHKAAGGHKVFTADEVHQLLDEAAPQVKAMILLGINCGFGNADCAKMRESNVDLKSRWIDFPRPKTGVERRCPLWPETVRAIRAAIKARPEPKDEADSDLMFITKYGHPWSKGETWNAVSQEFGKLLKSLKINGRRGLGFYSFRHTFRTIADGTKDFTAIRLIMGHADDSIVANYTHGVEDDRLQAVVAHVHAWLFAPKPKAKPRAKTGTEAKAKTGGRRKASRSRRM